MVKMDTDSNYLGISAESFEALIKPELREEFEKDKRNWFVTPLAPQGKRTAGLFNVEFKGDKSLDFVVNRIAQNCFLLKIHLDKSSSV